MVFIQSLLVAVAVEFKGDDSGMTNLPYVYVYAYSHEFGRSTGRAHKSYSLGC